MQTQEVVQSLKDSEIEATWTSVIDDWESATELQKTQLMNWAREMRDHFIAQILDVEDDEEIPYSVAIRYIEFQCSWFALNTQMNYQLGTKGECDYELQVRGTVLSTLIAAVEAFVQDDDKARINALLVQPITG